VAVSHRDEGGRNLIRKAPPDSETAGPGPRPSGSPLRAMWLYGIVSGRPHAVFS